MTKTRITVPMLGETISEAVVSRWLKKPGDTVREGEPVLQVETDKVTVEIPAPASGVLLEIIAKESDVLPIGALLGIVGKAGDELSAAPTTDAHATASSEASAAREAPAEQPVVEGRQHPPPRGAPRKAHRVVVIGGGTTGLTVATRLAQLGQQIDLVERTEWLGGDDVDGGGTARHAVLADSVQWRRAAGSAGPPRPTAEAWKEIAAHARKVEDTFRKAHESLRKARNITRHRGTGRVRPFLVDKALLVDVIDDAGAVTTTFEPDHVVVATGTEPFVPVGVHLDGERILAPRDVLALAEVPWRLVVLAEGATGLEWAMAFSELGAAVTLVDARPRLFPALDEDVEGWVRHWIGLRGVRILLAAKAVGTNTTETGVATHLALGEGGETDVLESDRVICAMARRAPMFHHVPNDLRVRVIRPRVLPAVSPSRAILDAVELAEHIASVNVAPLPRPQPEIVHLGGVDVAWVGSSEAELTRAGVAYRVGEAPFLANATGRATSLDGHAKIIVHAASDRVLGAQIWGPSAGPLIAEISLGIALGVSGDELARTPRPPGALSEVLSEAARSAAGWPLMLRK